MLPNDFKNNKFLKYSGLVVQIFVSIAIAAYFGKWLDRKFEMSKPIFTALCSITMLIMLMVWLNYDLKKQDE
jgi:membrane protein DedA with SNARE-associated domain